LPKQFLSKIQNLELEIPYFKGKIVILNIYNILCQKFAAVGKLQLPSSPNFFSNNAAVYVYGMCGWCS